MSPQLWAGPPTSPRESVALGPGIGREDEARRQRGWQRGPEPPATWTLRRQVFAGTAGDCGRWRRRGPAERGPLSWRGVWGGVPNPPPLRWELRPEWGLSPNPTLGESGGLVRDPKKVVS